MSDTLHYIAEPSQIKTSTEARGLYPELLLWPEELEKFESVIVMLIPQPLAVCLPQRLRAATPRWSNRSLWPVLRPYGLIRLSVPPRQTWIRISGVYSHYLSLQKLGIESTEPAHEFIMRYRAESQHVLSLRAKTHGDATCINRLFDPYVVRTGGWALWWCHRKGTGTGAGLPW